MPYIRQEDIVDGLFSKDLVDTYKINPGAELNGATTADPYALGFGLDASSPLQIKATNPGGNTDWDDEQDITVYNQDYDEIFCPFYGPVGSPAVFKTFLTVMPLTVGDLVGIWGGGSWTNLGINSALNTNRSGHGGAGTYSSMTVVGGADTTGTTISSTEFFNGINFSTASALNVSKTQGFSFGSSYAAVYGSGIDGGGTYVSTASFFNGNSWATTIVTPNSMAGASAFGSFNAAYLKSGKTSAPAFPGSGYYTNGVSWININTATGFQSAYSGATGTLNNGVVAGGVDSGGFYLSYTNIYNGLSFVMSTTLNLSINKCAIAGIGTAAILSGGENSSTLHTTQIYNGHMWITSSNSILSRSFHTSGGSVINVTVHGNSIIAAQNACETFTQSTYRKLTPENINMAGNIGVIFNRDLPAVQKCSVKLSGFIKGLPAATSFNYIVMKNNALDNGSDNNYQTNTSKPCSEDYLIGKYDAINTKLQVFSNFNKTYNIVTKWG